MNRPDWILRMSLPATAACLGIIAVRPYVHPEHSVLASSGKFDYVSIVSPMFLYKGNQGVLLMDLRNGNLWFIGKGDNVDLTFRDPIFVARLPLEKLGQAPQ